MLSYFKFENYRSFKDTTLFSMEKGSARKHKSNIVSIGKTKLLKSAIIFGGNANGKSNVLNALIYLRILILLPPSMYQKNMQWDTFGYNQDEIFFEISFIKQNRNYVYAIRYHFDEIISEYLKIDDVMFFARDKQKFDILPENLMPLRNNIKKNQNLLAFAEANNVEEAITAISWFVDDLIVINTEVGYVENSSFKLLENQKLKEKFLTFLQAADFNILDVEVKEKTVDSHELNFQLDFDNEGNTRNVNSGNRMIKQKIYDVYSTHQSANGTFEMHYSNESIGTQIFMQIALAMLQNENSNKVILIDEFDRSFHIELAQALLDVINSENQKNQFIMTSHQPTLMDHNLRQEQIYLVEKNINGESELFSIYDFDDPSITRSDFGYMKRYLQGRFGATQIINKSLLLSIMGNSNG